MTARDYATRYASLRRRVDRCLERVPIQSGPKRLTDACEYVLGSGGKRLRAILTLLSCEAAGGKVRDALHAGAAIEIMHNFTLVHDDIMDHATSRRGRPTVHVRWGLNNALLTGDVLLGLAYRQLLQTASPALPHLVALFTTGVVEVCKGQALDLEFEDRTDVSVKEYFRMIERKTGRLLSLAMETGALIGGGRPRDTTALRRFGHFLGRAFQLQDDLLDVVADETEFGKTIGGDIMEGKRTFLILTAASRARGADRAYLLRVLRKRGRGIGSRRIVVPAVAEIYYRYGVIRDTERLVRHNTGLARQSLATLPRSAATAMLDWLANALLHRSA
jgi:geranylgeranyl diphosphate synthase, type II